MFAVVNDSISFPKEEEHILDYWSKIDAFQTSLKQSREADLPKFTFYDGPPFATGLPHYGHILAGSIKDVVTRYAHQTGHHVERRFGWDCHGLPVEYEIDKALGITGPADVEAIGIKAYNAECRSIVMRYSSQWKDVITRMGRWIDFDNDYKTLDPEFMESVWWVFSTMYSKGLVFRGFKVMPYSTACSTPLSNFESGLNYKDVNDPALVVAFPVTKDPTGEQLLVGASFLAWTTTPWTLPSNLALCVNSAFDYVKLQDSESGAVYIVGKERVEELYPPLKKGKNNGTLDQRYSVLATFSGEQLVGAEYEPLFPYFKEEMGETAFRVLSDDYVTIDSGTGIVHQAPFFGEDDHRVCLAHNVIRLDSNVCPVDSTGKFTEVVTDFAGVYVKDADRLICSYLKASSRLVRLSTIVHSYPHCWRSDTPLIYKAVPSWFIDVPAIKDRLVANNEQTYWVPNFVKEKRFHNWLNDAREWAVSRNRYWGTPLPIWTSDDGEEVVVIQSIEELRVRSGDNSISDIHRDSIDHITIPSTTGRGVLKRVPEVFDCWFESGSMPYAQAHYPFDNKELFEESLFPANFIAEGLDQTRGWFYTLMVISTALFDKPPFQNLIVNGLVLAPDGKKMSKRLKNYDDPMDVVSQYGADALRLYLVNSPVVRAEPLRFRTEGVRQVLKDIFLPWFNTYRLFVSQARRLERVDKISFTRNAQVFKDSDNIMDKWIISALQTLIMNVRNEMEAYRLDLLVPHLLKYLDQLSKWYVRLNKSLIKGDLGKSAALHSLQTLFEVLLAMCKLMAPVTPFFVEFMYQNLSQCLSANDLDKADSVHYLMIPEPCLDAIDSEVETGVSAMQQVIDLGRAARERTSEFSMRFPFPQVSVIHRSPEFLSSLSPLVSYIEEQLNVRNVVLSHDVTDVTITVVPDNRTLGKKLKKARGPVTKALAALSPELVANLQDTGTIAVTVGDVVYPIVLDEDVTLTYDFNGDASIYDSGAVKDLVVVVSKVLDEVSPMWVLAY